MTKFTAEKVNFMGGGGQFSLGHQSSIIALPVSLAPFLDPITSLSLSSCPALSVSTIIYACVVNTDLVFIHCYDHLPPFQFSSHWRDYVVFLLILNVILFFSFLD